MRSAALLLVIIAIAIAADLASFRIGGLMVRHDLADHAVCLTPAGLSTGEVVLVISRTCRLS